MMDFSLDHSAVTEIKKLIAESHCTHPVAVLSMWTAPKAITDELYDALVSGNERIVTNVAQRELDETSQTLEVSLTVFVYEKESREDCIAVNGIEFELPLFLRTYLQDVRLLYEEGQFVLRNREGMITDLPFLPPASAVAR